MLTKIVSRSFSLARKIPIVNITSFLQSEQLDDQCKTLLSALEETGCALIKDPRVDTNKNDTFLDQLERYFTKRQEQIDRNQTIDSYPELHYEIGISPPNVTQTKNHVDFGQDFPEEHKPFTKFPLKRLSKLRYLWTIGQPGPHIAANRPPVDFPKFASVMDDWGNSNMSTVLTLSQMLAVAMKLQKDTFKDLLLGGANKLAPNANDLRRCYLWEPFTSLHYDFSFLTIHGRSRFPGLYIWLRNGEKIPVSIPSGHLLIQAGSELQYLTAGLIHRGFHEAINTPQVAAMADKTVEEGKIPWRITSTVFTHIRHDVVLRPLPSFASTQNDLKYPPVLQYDYFMKELDVNRT